jgi:DNA repair protein RecO (recombination protein O)
MQVQDKVIILRKTRYGDADLILNCIGLKSGRISLYARSALKSKKRFGGGVLEPTHFVQVVYEDKSSSASSENRLHTLKEALLLDGFDDLRLDYSRIEAGLHFVRLISEVVREGEVDSLELFNLLGNTLRAAEKSMHLDRLRTHFEVKLLAQQGVLPVEAEEATLLKAGIAAHDQIELSAEQWAVVRAQVRRVLREYLQHGIEA